MKVLRSSWYYNGEDVIFTDDAFHTLAYQITATYQRYMADMEREHGVKRARYEAWLKGWRHSHTAGIYELGQEFILPGYELRVGSHYDDRELHREASITMLFE